MPESEHNMKGNRASWLIILAPSIIGGLIAIAGIWSGYRIAISAQQQQQALEVSKLKTQILGSITTYEFRTAQILLKHALKPIDSSTSYAAFEKDVTDLYAVKAPEAPSTDTYREYFSPSYAESIDYSAGYVNTAPLKDLVKQFNGPERLQISDRLVGHYEQQPDAVVDAIINGLLPANDKWSYRVNLYIAFTLARIRLGWHGTREQWNQLSKLKDTNSYKEPTFRRRVDEALANYKG